MTSIWKDLHLNPRVESCFTCLRRVSFFCALSNCSAINRPRTLRVFSFLLLWTVILNWRSSITEFVSWRLCLVVFKTFSDRSGIRTHAHTRVPEFSTEDFLQSGASDRRPSCLVYVDIFFFDLCHFNWVTFSIQRCNLLNGLCHLFGKICI